MISIVIAYRAKENKLYTRSSLVRSSKDPLLENVCVNYMTQIHKNIFCFIGKCTDKNMWYSQGFAHGT
jgi:hypothetical protein